MGKHVHLLIATDETPLYNSLQGINQSYTPYFNRWCKTIGHLFKGGYLRGEDLGPDVNKILLQLGARGVNVNSKV
jgi:hypothetical protein